MSGFVDVILTNGVPKKEDREEEEKKDEEIPESCPICLEVVKDALTPSLRCKHVFCAACFGRYAASHFARGDTNITCPLCRRSIVASSRDVTYDQERQRDIVTFQLLSILGGDIMRLFFLVISFLVELIIFALLSISNVMVTACSAITHLHRRVQTRMGLGVWQTRITLTILCFLTGIGVGYTNKHVLPHIVDSLEPYVAVVYHQLGELHCIVSEFLSRLVRFVSKGLLLLECPIPPPIPLSSSFAEHAIDLAHRVLAIVRCEVDSLLELFQFFPPLNISLVTCE